MIPEDWEDFHFYAQVSDTGGGAYFYYNSIDYNEYLYILDIPKLYKLDEKKFKELKEVYSLCQKKFGMFLKKIIKNLGIHYDCVLLGVKIYG
ncbi:immunity protein YezG family protein [Listeria rocourtiae]|uniref:immunity protein YezG family protein n=1 Tax=Listeria rocourtiae TaxID=647910 RepID=UPI003D2F8B31